MNKYQALSDNEKRQLAEMLADDIRSKIVKPIENHDIICLNRIVIDKDLLQSLIKDLLYYNTKILKYIDLKGISFDNLNLKHKDLSETNADIDPQKVRDKSLYHTSLKGIDMSGKDFTDVEVRHADLERTNADIDPQKVRDKSLYHTSLKGIDMRGKDFTGVYVENADLEGTNANIDPQKVKDKSFFHTKLKGIDMCGKDFTDVDVRHAVLEGTNANINPQTVRFKSLESTKLKGLDMRDKDFTDVEIYDSNLDDTNATINYGALRKHDCSSFLGKRYCYLGHARLKSCKLYNVGIACLDDRFAIEQAIVMDNSVYEDAKKYIKSLFN